MLNIFFTILIFFLMAGIFLSMRQRNVFSTLLIMNYVGNIIIVLIILQFAISGSDFYLDIALIYALCAPLTTIFISRIIGWIRGG